jgi:YHS domain-containing protein
MGQAAGRVGPQTADKKPGGIAVIEFIQANATWLVLGAMFLLMMRMHGGSGMGCGGGHQHGAEGQEPRPDGDREGLVTMSKDPVCDLAIDPKAAAATIEYKGQTYYFCSADCKGAFEKNPEKFVQGQGGGRRHMMVGGG